MNLQSNELVHLVNQDNRGAGNTPLSQERKQGVAGARGSRERFSELVLIVNDQHEPLDLMGTVLEHSGYHFITARDGYEGYEAALVQRPELIISDVIMPRLDGIQMCHLIRAHADTCRIPILLVSAICKDNESVVKGLQAGADDYLEVPYDPMRLIAKVAQVIERRHAEKRLLESEERCRDLIENAQDLIYSHDLQGNIISINKAGEQMTGYSREEALKMNLTQAIAPEYLQKARQMIARKLAGERVTSYELEILAKDGRRVAVEVNTRLVYRDGAAVGVQGIARDITERKHLEEQLRQAQKMEAVGQLAGGIAHDFNNLLTAIGGYSEISMPMLQAEDPLRHNLEEIKKASDRATALTRQLLAFSRKQVLQPKVLDLNAIVAELEKMLRRLIGEEIELCAALNPDLGRIKADPGQIEQVIMNLSVNARDAMPQGGRLTIATENVFFTEELVGRHGTILPGAYVMLAVSDTGTGLDEKTKMHLFEPFFTTKEAGKGTGLGLSTVYGIIRQSGGNIWIHSEVGQGTTFKIYLPLIQDDAAQPRRSPEPEEFLKGSQTILLAEEEEMVRHLVRDVLKKYGYEVLEVSNGEAALFVCEHHKGPIHLLVTDTLMPELSGRELENRLGQLRPELKVLVMSGYTGNHSLENDPIDADLPFLQKPFTTQALVRKVREVLQANEA
jgi:two-component system, cell cycle sensor histidine kinase and response regulator CckA